MPPEKKYRWFIGIDCGVNTGFAVWDRLERKFTHVQTMKIHAAIKLLEDWIADRPEVLVRVEDARLRKWIPKGKTESDERGRREGAGSVKRDAVIWEDVLKDYKMKYEMVAPKNNRTKLTAETFKKFTGYQGQTSSHARDAAMLVFGY